MAEISVLTPSFGYGRFISDAVESVLRQGPSAEHIVQDGGSTDSTIEELTRFGDRVIWRSEPDAGQSQALNRALKRATGQWIGWLNADEFYLPRALEMLMAFGDQTGADVVFADAVFVDESGAMMRLVPEHRFSHFTLRRYGDFVFSCASLFKRSILGETPFDERMRLLMDWDLYLRLNEAGARFAHLAYPAAAFRLHPHQMVARPREDTAPDYEIIKEKHRLGHRAIGTWSHAFLKLLEGAYRRQLRARLVHGCSLRWFADEVGLHSFTELLRTSYSEKTGS